MCDPIHLLYQFQLPQAASSHYIEHLIIGVHIAHNVLDGPSPKKDVIFFL